MRRPARSNAGHGAVFMIAKIIHFLRNLFEILWRIPTRLFGSRNERLLKLYGHSVAQINALEPAMEKLSDPELAARPRS